MIRGAKNGDEVNLLILKPRVLYGQAWGIIQHKRILSQRVWYAVKIMDAGRSAFRKGDTIDCRPRWLTRRKKLAST